MEPVIFKQWTHNKYAILASFHKVILIATLSVSYNLLAQPDTIRRPDTASEPWLLELEEVETLAADSTVLEGILVKPVTIRTRQDILSSPSPSIDDFLKSLPQVDVRQRGRMGVQSDLSIQGGTFDQSLVLLNGIDLSDPQTGHFHLNLPVEMSGLQQVELLTGPATRYYGTSAFTGAVNFVTRPADSTYLSPSIRFGQHNYYKATLTANTAGKHFNTLANLSASGSDGYTRNTDFRTAHAFIHTATSWRFLKASLMLGINSRNFGANSFYTPYFPDQYEETTTGFSAISLQTRQLPSRWKIDLYWRSNRDHFLLDRNDPSFYTNDHFSQVAGANLSSQVSTSAGLTSISLQFRGEKIYSTSLGESLDEPHPAPLGDEVEFLYGHIRNQVNLTLNQLISLGPFIISGGSMFHLNSDMDRRIRLYPGIDIRWNGKKRDLQGYVSANRSMRLPTFTDLYYSGPANVGNPDLAEETAFTIESGITGGWKILRVSLNAYYRMGRNMIDWIWMEDEKWHTLNLTEVNAAGSSINFIVTPPPGSPGPDIIQRVQVSYQFNQLTRVSQDVVSKYVLDNLKHKAVLELDHRFIRNVSGSWRLLFQDRNGSYPAYDPDTGTSHEQSYDPFLIVDLKVSWTLQRFHLFAEVTNLMNTTYQDIGNVIQPGRWFMAGMAFR